MVTPESVKQGIEAGLACEHVEVAGDGQHFQALVVSAEFAGRSRFFPVIDCQREEVCVRLGLIRGSRGYQDY